MNTVALVDNCELYLVLMRFRMSLIKSTLVWFKLLQTQILVSSFLFFRNNEMEKEVVVPKEFKFGSRIVIERLYSHIHS